MRTTITRACISAWRATATATTAARHPGQHWSNGQWVSNNNWNGNRNGGTG